MESSPNQLPVPLPRKRKWAWTCGVLAAVGFIFIACGSDRPDGGNAAPPIDPSQGCSTPNEGCPCQTVGEIAQCGTVKHTGPDGYLTCSIGTRTCNGQTWGACFGEHDVRTKVLPPGQLHTNALGPSTQCPPGWNACDPYCMLFDDNLVGVVVDGGVTVVDGGLTIDPNAVDGGDAGSSSSTYTAPAGGVTGCSPNRNIVGPACTPANGLTVCQQDHRCDPTTNQCLWNNGPGYYNPSAGGPDLTVGTPCGPQGSATSIAPVCNRGSVAVPAGATITFHVDNGATPRDACTNLGPPTYTRTLTAALPPGGCTSFSLANSPGGKFVTVNAGPTGMQGTPEAPGRCANNNAYWKTDGSGGDCALCTNTCQTKLTGTIRDPRGVNPLPDVLVYVPGTTPTAVTDPPPITCDSCASLVSGNPLYQAVTAANGTFTMNVPSGGAFPLVIQTGRWRRIVTVPAVAACTTGTLSAALGRLPANKTEGTIPKMALVMAQGDSLQCLLRKIGIDDAEFTAEGGTGRVHLYTNNGMTFGGATSGLTNLWGNAANLSTYSAIIAPCDNNHGTYPGTTVGPNTNSPPNPTANAAQRANMKTYLDTGGRLFTTHWMSHDFVHLNWPAASGGPVQPEFGTNVDNDREPNAMPYRIDTSSTIGNTLSQWGQIVGAVSAGPPPTITFGSWRHLSKTVSPGVTRLSYGDSTQPPVSHPQNSTQWGGPHVNMYQFETPWGTGAPACGRVTVSQSHVSSGSGAFPGGCGSAATAMTAQEKAFEFLFFSSQACIGPQPPPPPPPTPPPLPSVVFSRDYFGSCPVGHRAVWQPFYWQGIFPLLTSIRIYAGTADTQAGLPLSETAPGVKQVGLADTTTLAPAWDCDGCPGSPVSVDYHLRNDPPPPNSVSKPWLRVFMVLNPNNLAIPPEAPTLTAWRQVYSCVPVE